MIVQITVPGNTNSVRYGKVNMLPDEAFHLDVPDYVAKTLITVPGVTCPADLSVSLDAMLAATVDRFETNYIFWAYGKVLPADTIISHAEDDPPAEDEAIEPDWSGQARALMTARGAPSVALS